MAHIYYFSKEKQEIKEKVQPDEYITKNSKYPISFVYCQVQSPYDVINQINKIGLADVPIKIVVDYLSFWKDKAYRTRYGEVVLNAIASFPEYDFYFDVTDCNSTNDNHNVDYLKFLFPNSINAHNAKYVQLTSHSLNFDESVKVHPYHQIILGRENLFDASNLRWAVIETLYNNKKQKGRNYSVSRESRRDNYACCVHSERDSSLSLCYTLYANGYRTSPIFSDYELSRTKDMTPKLIIRDSVLFFGYENRCSGKIPDVNRIRIFKKKIKFNQYWGRNTKYYFLSCDDLFKKINKTHWELYKEMFLVNKIQNLSNVELPATDHLTIDGIFSQLMRIGEMPKNIDTSEPNLERDENDVSRPIDTYDIVNSMIDRAFKYYDEHSYIHSAVVARTAIEINNCYFPSLWAKALYIMSLSENAISANNLLAKDDNIADDVKERIIRLKIEARRIAGIDSVNLINQILSDCRSFCKNKERFLAEDIYISEMAHLNEGFSLIQLITLMTKLWKRFWDGLQKK